MSVYSFKLCKLTLSLYGFPCMLLQGSQEQEVKFQDQIFSKFQDIFVLFTRLKTQKMHIYLCSQILISTAVIKCY